VVRGPCRPLSLKAAKRLRKRVPKASAAERPHLQTALRRIADALDHAPAPGAKRGGSMGWGGARVLSGGGDLYAILLCALSLSSFEI